MAIHHHHLPTGQFLAQDLLSPDLIESWWETAFLFQNLLKRSSFWRNLLHKHGYLREFEEITPGTLHPLTPFWLLLRIHFSYHHLQATVLSLGPPLPGPVIPIFPDSWFVVLTCCFSEDLIIWEFFVYLKDGSTFVMYSEFEDIGLTSNPEQARILLHSLNNGKSPHPLPNAHGHLCCWTSSLLSVLLVLFWDHTTMVAPKTYALTSSAFSARSLLGCRELKTLVTLFETYDFY